MYQLIIRSLLFISFLLVVGCGSSSHSGGTASTNAVLFDPTTSTVPLPNILATATAKDPLSQYTNPATGVVGLRPANTPMTPPEALAYVNRYEVGSTNAVSGLTSPVYIRVTSPLNPTSVTAANIKVFQLTPDSASSSATENNPLGFTDVTGMFTFQYTAGSTDIFLFPNFPLTPGARYLYLVTNRVLDSATGKPVCSSTYFDALKAPLPLVGPFAPLEAIRDNVYTDATKTSIKLSGYAKVMDDLIRSSSTTTVSSRNDITVLGRFITTGAGAVLRDTASAASIMPVDTALRSFAAGASLGGLTGKSWTNAISGTATLPPAAYWTAVGAGTAPSTVASVVTGNFNSAELAIDPAIASANASTMDLTAVTGAYNPAAGVVQPFRSSGILTGYYHSARSVPFVYIVPTGTAPAGGWPLVIFQHGITGQKEQVVAVAGALTAAGFAVVAIDLPLHGALSPTHAIVSGDNATVIAQKQALWGQDFLALGAPLATRSNIQQAAFNLHRLELTGVASGFAALGADAPNFSTVRPKYVGMSLGSIVGTYYLAGNTTLATSGLPYTQATLSADMKGFLSVPGGRLAYIFKDSPTLSPSVNAGLAASGIIGGTATYNQFFLVTQSVIDPADPASVTTPLATGLPSRLSGRIAIQEAVGDQVIPNDSTRFLGNALGGREVLGSAASAVAPGFKQLGYRGAASPRTPSSFMFTLNAGAVTPKVDFAAAQSNLSATTPAEGYFQFDQTGVNHGFLIDPRASATNTGYAQSQMVNYLLRGVVVDPTPTGVTKAVAASPVPAVANDIRLPRVLKILGY
jgi:hypothetical protein